MTYQEPVYDYDYYTHPEPPRRKFTVESKVAIIGVSVVAAILVSFVIIMLGLSPDKGTTPAQSSEVVTTQSQKFDDSYENDFITAIKAVGVTGETQALIKQGYDICDLLESGRTQYSVALQLRAGSISRYGSKGAITPNQATWVVQKANDFMCPNVPSI